MWPKAYAKTDTPCGVYYQWWDFNWLYRQEVIMTNPTWRKYKTWTVCFEIDSLALINAGKVHPNGHDLRLLTYTWKGTFKIYDIVVVNWRTQHTKIYFKDTFKQGAVYFYWLYYGNFLANPEYCDPLKVFFHGDHLEDQTVGNPPSTRLWEHTAPPPATGTVRVSGTYAKQQRSLKFTQLKAGSALIIKERMEPIDPGPPETPNVIDFDFHFHAAVYLVSNATGLFFTFYEPNWVIVFGINLNPGGEFYAYSIMDSWRGPNLWVPGRWYNLDLTYRFGRSSFSICWDDMPLLTKKKLDRSHFNFWNISWLHMQYYTISIRNTAANSAYVDDIFLRKYKKPEPFGHAYAEEGLWT